MWSAHEDNTTLKRYAQVLASFVIMIIRSARVRSSGFKLPLDSNQMQMTVKLEEALLFEHSEIEPLHNLLISCLQVDSKILAEDKWKCPIASFLPVSFMHEDGGWADYRDITPVLAMWTYALRSITLIDILNSKDALFNGDAILYVTEFTL